MVATLSQVLAALAPREVPVIFTGNEHATKTRGLPFSPPSAGNALGYRLKDRGFVHLGILYRGETIWTCIKIDGCGVQDGGTPGPALSSFSIGLSDDPADNAMDFAGRLTASLPAVTAGQDSSSQTR